MAPKGRCLTVAPGMASADMRRTVAHYTRLGFAVTRVGDDFAIAKRDGIELHFSLNAHHDPALTASWVYVRVADADALYEEWKAAGAERLRVPSDTDYKMRDGSHIDPDGNLITFGAPLAGA